jgi:hypothetical protein
MSALSHVGRDVGSVSCRIVKVPVYCLVVRHFNNLSRQTIDSSEAVLRTVCCVRTMPHHTHVKCFNEHVRISTVRICIIFKMP